MGRRTGTRVKGPAVRFDALIADEMPAGVTYNCGVPNLFITSGSGIPLGDIRMHGCPGSFVEGMSVDRVGCALLLNYNFGGRYTLQAHSLHYGVAVWDDVNANIFEVYCAQSPPWPKTVPPEYRPAVHGADSGVLGMATATLITEGFMALSLRSRCRGWPAPDRTSGWTLMSAIMTTGKNVRIGANAVVLLPATIGDGAIVAIRAAKGGCGVRRDDDISSRTDRRGDRGSC